VKYSPFTRGAMHVIGFARPHPVVRELNVLRHVPVVQEALHGYVVLEFER